MNHGGSDRGLAPGHRYREGPVSGGPELAQTQREAAKRTSAKIANQSRFMSTLR
jgi:hypothetical protein